MSTVVGDGSGLLRIGINVAAIPVEALGAGQYTVELVRALARRDDIALTLVARRDDATRWQNIAPLSTVMANAPSHRGPRLLWEEIGLTATVRTRPANFDVVHGPHYALPAWPGRPTVVTVHDLTFVDHPEWHERSKVLYFRRALRLAARRADVVVCVSERTARRFSEIYHPDAPIRVVPHGVDRERFTSSEPRPGNDSAVLDRLGVRAPYVLHTGTIQPRKDLVTLVAGFSRLADTHRELSLVLAGGNGWGTADLDAAIAASPWRERIVRLGHVDDADVPSLVRVASVVAYPSLEEGFGLPALEAMACGTALVTTQDSVMSELAGDAALLVPRSDATALADALEIALAGGPDVARRRLEGLERASTYTWKACAAGHVDAYREAAAG
ncbi:MAG: glycosyltransferase [Acidimicrobiaceae bacterium]|nr:glycosyltransferase [Acidimicrobiaceae bacterium]